MMNALPTSAAALSGAMRSRSITDQATHIGTSVTDQFAATIFGLIDDAPEQWARLVALSQEAPQLLTTQENLVASPYLKARSSTASSAHDSGYGPPPENNPDLGPSTDLGLGQNFTTTQLLHENHQDVISDSDARASLLSMSINERGYSGVGQRPKTAPAKISEGSTSPTFNSRATLRSRIKHGSTRISACVSDFCRPSTGYRQVSSSASSLSLREMLDDFPVPPIPGKPELGTSPTNDEAQAAEQPQLTESKHTIRPSTRSSIKGIFKNIKQRLSTREASELARQSTHRGSVMERGSVIVTPYDVVEWRQNGRSVRYLVSPRLMREGMLLASQSSLT